MAGHLRCSSSSTMAWPMAAPSSGSVPAPSSSISTSVPGRACLSMVISRDMCELNVLSDCCRLCSSPMSMRMSL